MTLVSSVGWWWVGVERCTTLRPIRLSSRIYRSLWQLVGAFCVVFRCDRQCKIVYKCAVTCATCARHNPRRQQSAERNAFKPEVNNRKSIYALNWLPSRTEYPLPYFSFLSSPSATSLALVDSLFACSWSLNFYPSQPKGLVDFGRSLFDIMKNAPLAGQPFQSIVGVSKGLRLYYFLFTALADGFLISFFVSESVLWAKSKHGLLLIGSKSPSTVEHLRFGTHGNVQFSPMRRASIMNKIIYAKRIFRFPWKIQTQTRRAHARNHIFCSFSSVFAEKEHRKQQKKNAKPNLWS